MRATLPGGAERDKHRGMWLARVAVGAAFVALVALNLDALVVQVSVPAPPDLAPPPLAGEQVVEGGGARRLGPCWRREREGQHVLYLEGDAFTLGYCNSRLAGDLMKRQEQALYDALATFVPHAAVQHLLVRALAWIYRDLPAHLTESERREVAGLAAGYADPFPERGPAYARILSYHAIHDIGQALVDNPLLGCTAFAVSGAASADGHTLLARNFDFEAGPVFDDDKTVVFVKPDHGLPFVSVAWAGMMGVVSGMNVAGIGVTINAAGSDDLAIEGTPTTVLVREVLQHARSLDDAIAILGQREVFVTDIFTVADGRTGEVAVVERTPRRIDVRRSPTRVAAANHLEGPAMAGDAENARRMRDDTTVSRRARLEELLDAGPVTPARAVAILRDRRTVRQTVGLGHRGTIDALIASHSVVFDLTARRLWVSRGPHTLGPYLAYDLDAVFGGNATFDESADIPADPLLADGTYDRFRQGLARFEAAKALLDDGRAKEAVEAARAGLELAPDHPPGLYLLGRACAAAGDAEGARRAWARFLDQEPPYRADADRVRAWMAAR
jgi:hypothetical protein